jgi:acetylglutamate kinase
MDDPLNATPQQKSEILMQALPHMLRYDDAIVVVKTAAMRWATSAKRKT